ncbi:MAG: RNA polymerase sigma-70 factor [Flammeovirgaceae bacterium]
MAKKEVDPTNEEQLVQKVKEGDQAAWDYIARTYYQPLFGYVMSMVRERESAEELVQDVFVNFWAKREKINITASLKAYLYRAARNHTLNFIKRRNFELNYQRSLAERLTHHHNDTEQAFHYSELEKRLYNSIEALPEKRKEIFMMSRFEDLTYKEIAATLDIPVRQVHYQIGLALKELRSKLKGLVDYNLMSGWWTILAIEICQII